jgi:hypothetical protein
MRSQRRGSAQPKSIAGCDNGTVFVAELGRVEAIRDNQKVFELPAGFAPSAVAAHKNVVAVGGEVRSHPQHPDSDIPIHMLL